MKRLIALLMALVMCVALCACASSSEQGTEKATETKSQSSSYRDLMTTSEKEEEASKAAVLEVARRLENKGYYTDNGKYKIGSVIEAGKDTYSVSGTIYVYDKYGSLDEVVTFTCDTVWIDENGNGVSVGDVDMNF